MKKRIVTGIMVALLCMLPTAVNAQTFLTESEFHHYIGNYDCTEKVFIYRNAYDQDGREMFTLENGKENYFGSMPGVETIFFYQNEKIIEINDSSESSGERRTIRVSEYVENKMVNYSEYEKTTDKFDTPSKEVEIEYTQLGSEMVGISKGEDSESTEVIRYDQNGNICKQMNEYGYSEYQYNTKGDLISAKNRSDSHSYNNTYDLEGKLIDQQMVDAESDKILRTSFYKYDTIDFSDEPLTGYWIEEGISVDQNRKMIAFSANGLYFTAHVNNPAGLPFVDSAGYMDIYPEEGHIEYSGNHNYSPVAENGMWDYEIQDGTLVLDGIRYQRV